MSTRPLGTALLINWDYVEIVDDLNLIFHLKAPYGAIMNALCSRVNYISCKSYWEEVGGFEGWYNAAPIGTDLTISLRESKLWLWSETMITGTEQLRLRDVLSGPYLTTTQPCWL